VDFIELFSRLGCIILLGKVITFSLLGLSITLTTQAGAGGRDGLFTAPVSVHTDNIQLARLSLQNPKRKKRRRYRRSYRIYRVRRGDSLDRIARRYGLSKRSIIRLNRLRRPYWLYLGQRLKLPRRHSVTKSRSRRSRQSTRRVVYRVRRGDMVSRIARRYGVSTRSIIRANRLRRPYRLRVGQRLRIPGVKRHRTRRKNKVQLRLKVYRVRRGDYLGKIARRHKVSTRDIIRLNRLRRPYRVKVGQRLKIPLETPDFPKKLSRKSKKSKKYGYKTTRKVTISKKGSTLKNVASKAHRTRNNTRNNTKVSRDSRKNRRYRHHNTKRSNKPTWPDNNNGWKNRERSDYGSSNRHTSNYQNKLIKWVWPTQGKLIRRYSKTTNGIGIGGISGQYIVAAAPGKIVYIGNSLGRYGKLVIIKHNKTFFTAYAHNRRLFVREGQWVNSGQKIAEMGSTGTNRVMLHFEIRKDGRSVNPMRYLPKRSEFRISGE
jgi:murein DD-endopeptidase MepM/ murein hydrolase activator NlpD